MPKIQEGWLTKRCGKWIGHFNRYVLDHSTGKKKRRQHSRKLGPVSQLTIRQAREKLRALIVAELHVTQDGSITVAGFIEQRWKPMVEGGWRDSSTHTNEDLLRVLNARFGSVPIQKMDGPEMQSWLNTIAKTRSDSQVKHLRLFLRSIMKQAQEEDFIRKNPALRLTVPRTRAIKRPYLSLEQIEALLKAADFSTRDKALLRLVLVTALRPSEIFALRWSSINFDTGTMTITETIYRGDLRPYTKTNEEGEAEQLVIPKPALWALIEWSSQTDRKGASDFIFPNGRGGFLLERNYQHRVFPVLQMWARQYGAEIPKLNFQILRRTVATHAAELGSLKSVQTILRHRRAETTANNYIRVIEASVKETAEAIGKKLITREPIK